MEYSFASENFAPVHPAILQAIADANQFHDFSYGADQISERVNVLLREHFGQRVDVYFAYNGTGANNFSLSVITQPCAAVFCTDVSHLYVDESTAPETFTGCRLSPVLSIHGKMIFEELVKAVKRMNSIHNPVPGVVTITQPTEYGTIYSVDEIKLIARFCRDNGMSLHMDGARYFNAAAALHVPLGYFTYNTGVDVLTLGGTKNGMMFGEAVLFFSDKGRERRKYQLKRSMQMSSKTRFIAAQFEALMTNDLWRDLAGHANSMAVIFESEIRNKSNLVVTHPVETNAVFLKMDEEMYQRLNAWVPFYRWGHGTGEVRIMFSHDIKEQEIHRFIYKMKQ
ncbi:MAG TPA: beta-eliminating lyase-related protein [Chitinophagaceae bacterium]|nr:beta-eliminating lyase-related protein [Chitinophagaceae bacterium]